MPRDVRRILRAAAVAALFSISGRGWAASTTYTWIGTGSGNWSNPANWSGGIVPVSDKDSFLLFTGTGSSAFAANNDLSIPFATYIVNIASSATSIQLNGGPLEFVAPTVQATPPNPPYPYLTRNSGSGPLNIGNNLIVSSDLVLNNNSTTPMTFSGVISGPAKIKPFGGYFTFTTPHTIAGGVDAVNGEIQVLGAGNLGTGPLHIASGASTLGDHFTFDSAANVASGDGSITIDSGQAYITFNTLNQAALNRINPASHGTLALTGNSSVNLDFSNLPGMRLGTWFPGTGAGVAPGQATYSGNITPANNTWRFGGMDPGASDFSNADLLVVSSLLSDGPSLQGRSVSIEGVGGTTRGGRVRLTNVNNSYSGGTVIQATGSLGLGTTVGNTFTGLSFDYTPSAGQTPLGTGDVIVNGGLIFEGAAGAVGALPNNFIFKPGSRLVFSNALGNNPYQLFDGVNRWGDTKPIALETSEIRLYSRGTAANEQVGQISFSGYNVITVDWQGTSGSTTFRASSFARTGRANLLLLGSKANQFALGDRFGVTDAASVSDANGIVYPYILGDDLTTGSSNPHGYFLRVVGGLFQIATPVNFDPSTEDEVAHWGSSATLLADETAWDLRMLAGFSMTIASGKTLTLKGGGLIAGGNTSLDTISGGNLKFDNHGTPVEAVIYNNNDASITSNLIGTAGLTKWGTGTLTLRPLGNNLGLSGTITVNQGYLKLGNGIALNNQPVVLNNTGGLDIGGFDLTLDSITGRGTINNSSSTMKTFTFNTMVDSEFAGSIGSVSFGTKIAMNKIGPGELTISGTSSVAGPTTIAEGTLTMSGPQLFNPIANAFITGDFFTAAGSNLNFKSNYVVLNLLGGGNTTIGPNVTFNANRLLQGTLALQGGSKVIVTQNGTSTGTSSLGALNIAGSADNWQASLDLKNNSLVVDGGDLQQISNQIRAGLLNGSGITSSAGLSSRRLGAILNNAGAGALYGTFDGITGLDGNEVLVKYTIIGDLNLDGRVSIGDFIDLAAHFNTPTGATWQIGDVNYDGAVSIADFIDLASNFGQALAGDATPILPQDAVILESFAAANVPEPALLLPVIALAAVCPRQRRRCS